MKSERRAAIAIIGGLTILGTTAVLALTLAFENTWGGAGFENAGGVAVAADGNIYVTGRTSSFGTGSADGDNDAFLLKYAPDGTLIWQRTYGVGRTTAGLRADDFANDTAVGPGGSVYITGTSASGHALLAKFTPDGALVWDREWGGTPDGDAARGVTVAGDGSVYVTGVTNNFGAGFSDMFLLKFAADGTLVWERTWGGAINEEAHDAAVAADGSVYVAGEGNTFFGNDAILVKFASDGTLVWQRDWSTGGSQDESSGQGVAISADGSVYLTGRALVSGAGQNIFLIRFTAAGDAVWQRTWGADSDAALRIATASSGVVYVSGNSGFGTNGDAFVVGFAPSGKTTGASTWGSAGNDSGQSIAVGPDGAAYIAVTADAPPFVFSRAPKNTKTPKNTLLRTPNGIVTTPIGNLAPYNGTVLTPAGSQTFAGATDAALLKILP